MMPFSQLEHAVDGKLDIHSDVDVSRFSTDSRNLTGAMNEVFIAVSGKRDGHDYAKEAWEKGIRNFILSRELDLPQSNSLIVTDTTAALQSIGAYHRSKFKIPIIGITGSNGKTTVKEWLSTILSEKFFVVKSPKSYNSQIGVPLSLLEIRETHEIGVFEAGISKPGEMLNLQKIIDPSIGIFTNIGQAHDDGFESTEHKVLEKLNLFHPCVKVICRNDQEYFQLIAETLQDKAITWSLKDGAKYQVTWSSQIIKVDQIEFEVDFNGETQLENLTHAIVTAMELGLSRKSIQKGIDLIEGVPMRLELKKGINGCYILDDSYNNDEAGLKVALDYLESHQQNEKRTLILSDLLHSGKSDEELYSDIAVLLNSKRIDRLIGVGPRINTASKSFSSKSLFYQDTQTLLDNFPDFHDEMIVVKGARNFELERVVNRLESKSHGTVLEVNFEALQHNLNQYRSLLKPKAKLMVMVKANAYGSGLLEVANFLQHQQVDMLGVAYVDEAVQLRKNGINIPIMIMNPHTESFEQFERYDLQAEIFSISHLKRMLKDTKKSPKIHLKIDTGMHRLGFNPEEIDELITILNDNSQVKVEGVFTHFSSSDLIQEDGFTNNQAELFENTYQKIANALGYQPIKHACNSPGIVRWPQYHFDMVRLGIGLHGFDPTGQLSLRHSSQLKSIVSQIQNLKAGETVGYSRKGKVSRDSQIAIIPIGYEDGFQRVFGNGNGRVNINGTLCPTIGNICMDMTMVDVTEGNVHEGDPVIIFGETPGIKDLAKWANTIPYEILTNVSNRVKRVFISE
ncbi:bifunctional UDP-N-acetylmuramoyl-tripeptide:D-alanyl-D-alanine ligase/alanine racemase [Ekhidna sp.]|uniref:bifunctional UDP-N-acetylmuramoyl-tripeptide:D-alanyl-D-alanine ligase/alanine racemase n=1 Tax=Ekhidna sp. TaxID=2608089 RepID=UPI003B512FEB